MLNSDLTKRILGALLPAAVAAAGFAQRLEIDLVKQQVIEDRLHSGVVRPSERQAAIGKLFDEAGCTAEEQRVDRKSANVICTLAGETPAEIVVGGHFDFVEHGQGIVDDWSGASLLPSLYQALASRKRQHTYRFVAFTEEERGLVGSSRFVRSLTADQQANVRAFVNLECLGLTPVKVWTHRADPGLLKRLLEVSRAVGITLEGVNVEKVGDDDSHPFLNAKIPAITLHSVTQETLGILHSGRDRVKAIQSQEYYDAYRLAAFYLAYLDQKLN